MFMRERLDQVRPTIDVRVLTCLQVAFLEPPEHIT